MTIFALKYVRSVRILFKWKESRVPFFGGRRPDKSIASETENGGGHMRRGNEYGYI